MIEVRRVIEAGTHGVLILAIYGDGMERSKNIENSPPEYDSKSKSHFQSQYQLFCIRFEYRE